MMRFTVAVFLSFTFACAGMAAESPANSALVPVPKLENDSYDWYARHQAVLQLQKQIDPQVVLIGDSITHFWGGRPDARARGAAAFAETFGALRVLNMGFGWDRIQNVLWRLENGEMDGLSPALIVLHIGTNNTSQTKNARANTPEEIVEGIGVVCGKLIEKAPKARILLMNVFPREEKPDAPRRKVINEINRLLAEKEFPPQVIRLDIGALLTNPDGTVSRTIMGDFCHPTNAGYLIWGRALKPVLNAYFPETK